MIKRFGTLLSREDHKSYQDASFLPRKFVTRCRYTQFLLHGQRREDLFPDHDYPSCKYERATKDMHLQTYLADGA